MNNLRPTRQLKEIESWTIESPQTIWEETLNNNKSDSRKVNWLEDKISNKNKIVYYLIIYHLWWFWMKRHSRRLQLHLDTRKRVQLLPNQWREVLESNIITQTSSQIILFQANLISPCTPQFRIHSPRKLIFNIMIHFNLNLLPNLLHIKIANSIKEINIRATIIIAIITTITTVIITIITMIIICIDNKIW